MTTSKGGPPLKYLTPEALQTAIDEYFTQCDNRLVQGYDNKTNEQFAYISPEPYTMSGLAYALDLSRRGLLNYKRKDKFVHAIKRARRKVQTDVERRLMEGKGATAGAIFNLKNNFGWKDESKVENTVILPKPLLSKLDVSDNDSTKET